MTSPKDALPRRKLLRVRVLTTKGNRYLVPLQGAEEQSQAPEEDGRSQPPSAARLLEEGGRCTRHSLPPQWETWDLGAGGAGVCRSVEGVGPAVQRECQQENSKQKMDEDLVPLKGTTLPVWDIQLHAWPLNDKLAAESFLQGPQELSSSTGGVISNCFHFYLRNPTSTSNLTSCISFSTRKANFSPNFLQQVKFIPQQPYNF